MHEEKQGHWKKIAAGAAMALFCTYTVVSLNGSHGIGALRAKLDQIKALRVKHSDLKVEVARKRERVNSLAQGQDVEMEMRRYGRTMPGEVEYKVNEPKLEELDPADDPPADSH